MMDAIQRNILDMVAGIRDLPSSGAFNIRVNGGSIGYNSTENIKITLKPDKTGLEVHVKPGTKNETVYIPVVISETNLRETVYNDFFIGKDSDILIVAGCGIDNCGGDISQHDGVHSFHVEKNAKVKYVEKHFGTGAGTGERVLNPVTNVFLSDGSYMEMETTQIKGVDSTKRTTNAVIGEKATFIVWEKLMTHGTQYAETIFDVSLDGADSSTNVVSRAVAKGSSKQLFLSKIKGNNKCAGHSECDAIIMDSASVSAIPEITANDSEASLIHEAAIGKIAGEQIIKLMTLGLSEKEAEEQIVAGFLK